MAPESRTAMRRHIAAVTSMVVVASTLLSGAAWANPPSTLSSPGQQPPVNTALPSISGTAQAGNTLAASPGTWDGKALKYAYQWQRCDSSGASCSPVAGATASTYTLTSADVGATMRVVVTASNQNGSAVATSAATAVIGAASSASSSSSATPPSATSSPTISGAAQQGQTLYASAGSWSGSTPMSYAYQWQRCDSSGGSCAPISGATASSYLLGSADVGSTIRVAATASNSAGSATAISAATAVVAALTSTSTTDYVEYFDGSFTDSFWSVEPAGALSWVPGPTAQGGRLTDCASSSASAHCTTSGSSYGQLAAFAVPSRPTIDNPHAGRVLGSGTNCCDGDGQAEDTWYRFELSFPTGYAPTPGTQNTVFALHVDDKTQADSNSFGNHAYSTLIGVQGQGTSCPGSPAFCTSPGTQPRLFIQIPGGSTSQLDSTTERDFFPLPLGSLLIDHWYDVVLHVYWSSDPTVGHVQWWLDGTKVLDVYTPTLYKRSDGTLSYGENLAGFNYRLWANWASSVNFDDLYVGPTAGSVGFTVP